MNDRERYSKNKREMRKRKKKMRGYICIGIMCLACIFSFLVGRNVGTVQARKEADAEVAVMENVQMGETENTEPESESTIAENDIQAEESLPTDEQDNEKEELPEESDPFADLDKSAILLVNKYNKLPDDYEVTLKKLPDGRRSI